ncbi:tetraketide alpha-pyrone reductase 1-like [Dendrobium catenatum]|uniref:Tetraketide alpha-pyrone reductase 1 n=1 Tax=Dendrobium catenatum TaxID=906689 RepID=A0A2I0VHM8_9ASPA|nr:tetraketide alpha-pyrone reductase 1-like [Dendrobium catenatum]PKU62874.1 Tetraketide alpha-pyrone reductase 1 [Dendrobium catenatum]
MEEHTSELRRVCVTGAGGFIASWLVKLLLSKGYKVHGTVRDPSSEKNAHLRKLDNATENLQLFKADLLDYNAIEAAIFGCEGVFHVASPVILSGISNPEVELIRPALLGTRNIFKACSKTNIKKVVVVSSNAAIAINPDWPHGTIMDERCWSDEDFCRASEKWYCLSKTMAEREAFKLAQENGLDVVTLCLSMVFGPLLQSNVNYSSSLLINLLKGSSELIETYRSGAFVDVRDVADALLLVYETPTASGRYICSLNQTQNTDLIDMLKNMYPSFKYPNNIPDKNEANDLSSEKLKKIGWKCRTLKETIDDSVKYYQEVGLLSLE